MTSSEARITIFRTKSNTRRQIGFSIAKGEKEREAEPCRHIRACNRSWIRERSRTTI